MVQTLVMRNKSAVKNENITHTELAEELQKSIMRKSKKRKLCSSFIDNIWDADLSDMKLRGKFNTEFRFL